MSTALDEAFWETGLASRGGPRALRTRALIYGDDFCYSSLYDYQLEPPAVPAFLASQIKVVLGRKHISTVEPAAEVASHLFYGDTPHEDRWIGVFLRSSGAARMFTVTAPWEGDNHLAWLRIHWAAARYSADREHDGMAERVALWTVLAHEVAKAGFVGLLATFADAGLHRTLTQRFRLMQPVREVLRGRGLLHAT